MPRPSRICAPGIPLHIVQRGNNREKCFLERRDFLRYLGFLANSKKKYGARLHAYALMTNHVHLLITPNFENSASRLMQNVGSAYVQSFNRIHSRTGTLWEGRFRSFPISSEEYLLACYRYIELNPVQAGIVQSPDEYPWSSYRANALGAANKLLDPSESWLSLGQNTVMRCQTYRKLFDTAVDDLILEEMRVRAGSDPG